ncbi:TPA: hypothetical protein H1V30_000435 [Salmonella enterica]|nr:hypothetical protein [Salmonella enterica]
MTTGAIVVGLALIGFASGVDAASRFGQGWWLPPGCWQAICLRCLFCPPFVSGWRAIATACQSEVLFHQLNVAHTRHLLLSWSTFSP